MQKNHCFISNIENLVAKIRSVKFSFLLSIDRPSSMERLNAFAKSIDPVYPVTDFLHIEGSHYVTTHLVVKNESRMSKEQTHSI